MMSQKWYLILPCIFLAISEVEHLFMSCYFYSLFCEMDYVSFACFSFELSFSY